MSKDDEIANLKQQLEVEKLHWIEDDRDLNELVDERNRLKKQLEEANKRNEFLESDSIKQEDLLEQTRLALEERDSFLTENKQLALDKERIDEALKPLRAWWAFTQAQYQLENDGKSIPEDMIALTFMGSGASTNVTVAQLNAAMLTTETKQGG